MVNYRQYAVTKTKDGVTKTIYVIGKDFPEGSWSEKAEQERLDKLIQEQLDE